MEQQGLDNASGVQRPRSRASANPSADLRRDLRNAVLSRVLPRLSELGRNQPEAATTLPLPTFTLGDVHAFADLTLAAALPDLVRHVESLRAGGRGIEAILLDLLAPTARYLGDLWLADRLSFFEVTAGLGRLQGILRALGPDFDRARTRMSDGRRILLAAVEGDQHVFGLSIVAAFFRRVGWDVAFEPDIARERLVHLVHAERFDVIGLTAAGDRFIAAMPAQVEAIRRASLAKDVTILAGGPAFLTDPDLGRRVGADGVARNAAEAVRVAHTLSGRLDRL